MTAATNEGAATAAPATPTLAEATRVWLKIGLLSFGIIGAPILGVAFDRSIHETVVAEAPALAEAATAPGGFLWMSHEKIEPGKVRGFVAGLSEAERASVEAVYNEGDPQGEAQVQAGRDVLLFAVRFPAILFLVFGLIALYFRRKGGYKPIEL